MKNFTFKEMMQFAHDLEKFQENLDMAIELIGDSELKTMIKKK